MADAQQRPFVTQHRISVVGRSVASRSTIALSGDFRAAQAEASHRIRITRKNPRLNVGVWGVGRPAYHAVLPRSFSASVCTFGA